MNKLYREPDNGYLGGVCKGLETHTEVDARLWRLAALFIPGGIAIYLLLWVFTEEL